MSQEDIKTVKRPMTDKQKQARLANLEAGRKKRKEMIAQKNEEYDLSSEDSSETESDNEAFVISKKKRKQAVKKPIRSSRSRDDLIQNKDLKSRDYSPNEFSELKQIVTDLAHSVKKQAKDQKKKVGGTKIVVLPNNSSQSKPPNDNLMDALRKSLM